MQHVLIIGTGGVASYLLPVLIKTFHPKTITLVDKDILEARNLDRQMFDAEWCGRYKADALLAKMGIKPVSLKIDRKKDTYEVVWPEGFKVIRDWFDEGTNVGEDIDCIFSCADNHLARFTAMNRANNLGCFAYIGGNEYVDSQAMVHHRDFIGGPKDLLRKYPNIATSHEGSPFRCTGEVQEASPQLAMANLNCAAKLLHLAWVYERYLPGLGLSPNKRQEMIELLPVEFYSSLFSNDSSLKHE